MTRVGLIVTGECERKSLATTLQRFFDGLGAQASFEVALMVNSFTSCDVGGVQPVGPVPTTVRKFASALVAEVETGGWDLVVGIDDLELVNQGQSDAVVRLLGVSLREVLRETGLTHSLTERLRSRASFHLLSPMLESLFFADSSALALAINHSIRESRFSADLHDFEEFVVDDKEFLGAPELREGPSRDRTWAISHEQRARHPKAYVKFLAQPLDPRCVHRRYRETHEGARALAALHWEETIGRPHSGTFTRAMLEDVAHALDVELPAPLGILHPTTRRRDDGVLLRNL